VVIAIHGRGASAQSILTLSEYFDTKNTHWIAPQATNNTWYPYSFMEPIKRNEPWFSSAIDLLDAITNDLRADGFTNDQIFIMGFSQGACLATEYASRRSARYGGVIAFSGGLIGHEIDASNYTANFAGTPVFIGCSDHDFHIPESRVLDSAEMLKSLGAETEAIIYPGMGHTIIEDEIEKAKAILEG
jgi:phospholipase/carboxylesterase